MALFTIIGRGLAGAVLYEVLRERGVEVRVVDRAQDGSASRAAAGVVNPIVLRRIVPSWRATELLPMAGDFYRRMEQRYGVKLWHPLPLVRLFADERERDEWRKKCFDPALSDLLAPSPLAGFDEKAFRAPSGYGVVPQCAWFDVHRFLSIQRERMLADGSLTEELFASNPGSEPGAGEPRTTNNDPVIHTTGPFSKHPGLVPVKGEVLTVRIPGLGQNAIVNRNAFLLPLGEERFRLGATFSWDDVWSGPSEEAKMELLQRLARITTLPGEVEAHHAGVRPTSRDRRPILGRAANGACVFNGLGSRGVLLAPWCAMHLADHLLEGAPLDPEVDAARYRAS